MKKTDKQSLVGPLVRGFLERHPAFSASPLGDWSDLVGEQIARYSLPKSLKDRVLVIVAFDSVWKHHLELNKDALIEKINGKRPEPLVTEIRVRVGEVPEAQPVLNPNHTLFAKMKARRHRPQKREKAPARKLTPEEKALLKSLPDPDLRTIGARLLKRIPAEDPTEE